MPILLPHIMLKDITHITPELILKYDIKALVLDIDNTLTTHDNPVPYDAVLNWLESMKRIKMPMLIVSNNSHERVKLFADSVGVDFLADGGKPFGRGLRRAQARFRLPGKQIAVVGDQIFTDVLGANFNGMISILVEPFELEEKSFFKVKRRLERPFIRRFKNKENNHRH